MCIVCDITIFNYRYVYCIGHALRCIYYHRAPFQDVLISGQVINKHQSITLHLYTHTIQRQVSGT